MAEEQKCEICAAIQQNLGVLYKNDKLAILLDPRPVTDGHVIITTIEHYPIIEQVPEETLQTAFKFANKMSVILFESLRAQGTNIFVNNGLLGDQDRTHFTINIVPRKEKDNLDFAWKTEQASEELLTDMQDKLVLAMLDSDNIKSSDIKSSNISSAAIDNNVSDAENEVVEETDEGEDYRIKQLERIP